MATKEQGIGSVWTREQPRRRREQPALSRDQIVAEALNLLDEEGPEALSMRKLGARLGAGATSLYTYVANKDELMELVADATFGEVPPPAAGADWRSALTGLANDLRAMILRHPWLSIMLGEIGLLYLGPNVMRLNEALLTLLEENGFDDEEADNVVTLLFSFVLGMAISEAASRQTIRRSGLSDSEWFQKMWPAAEAATRGYPRLHRRYTSFDARTDGLTADMDTVRDEGFAKHIARLLDGVQPPQPG
ncbi:TetR/AcrR family transcriptional regulator [Nocardia sp. IFM 10818]